MAEAAGHKWGQFVGEYCESALEPLLQEFANKHGLFLDKKGPRPARSGKKLRWVDSYGNGHDLDYVLERGGTPNKIGTPRCLHRKRMATVYETLEEQGVGNPGGRSAHR